MITESIKTTLLGAESKVLASYGTHGINVVPVSMIKVSSDSIWLFNFFMDKTIENILSNNSVALTAWKGMEGIQIKGKVTYTTEGELFDQAVAFVISQNPTRNTKGLLILTPEEIFDVCPFRTT